LSLADLAGDWALVAMDPGGTPPADVAITARFEDGQVSGSSGCNRYTVGVVSGEGPGDVNIPGPLAGTRMMCPDLQMEWEDRYLKALQGVANFSFLAGDLVLSWTDGENWGSLRFQPVAVPAESD